MVRVQTGKEFIDDVGGQPIQILGSGPVKPRNVGFMVYWLGGTVVATGLTAITLLKLPLPQKERAKKQDPFGFFDSDPPMENAPVNPLPRPVSIPEINKAALIGWIAEVETEGAQICYNAESKVAMAEEGETCPASYTVVSGEELLDIFNEVVTPDLSEEPEVTASLFAIRPRRRSRFLGKKKRILFVEE